LLTDKGDAKVADFGIARAGSSVTISRTGSVMGTAGYMSPEQALGKPATPKSDLYSLGVVLYEALTGELPYTADNPIAVSMKHVNEPLVPPREIDPTIPEGMNALITRLMAKDPEDRYASANELADDLWRVSRGLAPTAVPADRATTRPRHTQAAPSNVTSKVPPARPARRRKGIPWLLIVVAAILLFLGTYGILKNVMGPNATNGWFDVFGGNENPPAQPSAPQKVTVPKVTGLTTAEAQQKLIDAGLKVGLISQSSSTRIAAGRVITPGYPEGARVDRGTEVNLTVSSGPPPVSSSSPTATAGSSPEPTATASPTASAQPSGQGAGQAAQQPADTNNVPKTKKDSAASSPDPTASAGALEDKGAKHGVDKAKGNSGPGGNSGNSGPGGGKVKD
jgi:serine/threonine protein kinase